MGVCCHLKEIAAWLQTKCFNQPTVLYRFSLSFFSFFFFLLSWWYSLSTGLTWRLWSISLGEDKVVWVACTFLALGCFKLVCITECMLTFKSNREEIDPLKFQLQVEWWSLFLLIFRLHPCRREPFNQIIVTFPSLHCFPTNEYCRYRKLRHLVFDHQLYCKCLWVLVCFGPDGVPHLG